MKTCRDINCGDPLTPETTSTDSPGFCKNCGDLVYAFRPNLDLPDEWFAIGEGEPTEAQAVSANQCGVCGLTGYILRQSDRLTWVAVCSGQVYDGDVLDGCYTQHPVRMKRAGECIW